ncbi:hypothetical protein I8748_06730 [Nostoc sp. CENA67]|uniref:Uncharacterized protein n=1 Tax=Amazonocrinis nigriterrae CENA67 TaxID=2794033 RepID=A0A8J7L8C1_9NOST|nr:hypothetical protein [Amazonocrinis nigriterrae CENA67]
MPRSSTAQKISSSSQEKKTQSYDLRQWQRHRGLICYHEKMETIAALFDSCAKRDRSNC